MSIASQLLDVLKDGQPHDIAEVSAQRGWNLDSAKAAARVLRRPQFGHNVRSETRDGKTFVRIIPRGLEAWLPATSLTVLPADVQPEQPLLGTDRNAPSTRFTQPMKTKRPYKRKSLVEPLDCRAIARDILIDVLTRGVAR